MGPDSRRNLLRRIRSERVDPYAKIAMIVGLLILGSFAWDQCAIFWAVDACMDRGSRWNYELNRCDP